jgi:signal transduction histidine kinase
MNRDLGISAHVYGVAAGAFFRSYSLLAVPCNLALHKIGARVWLGSIMIAWGLAAAATTGPLFSARGVGLTLELEGDLPPVRADADRIMQVAINLLANAAKFVPEGSGQVRLLLSGVVGGQSFEVVDNGPGIAPADQAVIFERFRQVGKTAGSGLGLAISRAIVEGHGGRLSLRSAPGDGAAFRVVLPG